ncbi:MAG: glycosyltransferase [Chitinophagales bacterium]
MKELAPIVVFAYNRPNHLRQTLESLSKNILASESILYLFCDGAKEDASTEEKERIDEVRKIASEITWPLEKHIITRIHNYGLAKNIIEGVTEIVNKHGKIIVLEDDLLTGPGFLNYMNQALNLFEHQENVVGVSAHTHKLDTALPPVYLLPIGISTGWGTWRDAWSIFEPDPKILKNKIDEFFSKEEFNFGGYPFYQMLIDNIEGKNNSWAIRWYASFFLKSNYFVFPNAYFTIHEGFDDLATNASANYQNIYGVKSDLFTGQLDIGKDPVTVNEKYINIIRKEFLAKTTVPKNVFLRLRNRLKNIYIKWRND